MKKRILLAWTGLFASLSLGVAAAGQGCPTRPELGEKVRRYTGSYKNLAYGYATRVPDGLTGQDADDPEYQKGFVLFLPNGGGTVWVSAEVNGADYREPRAAAEFDVGVLRDVAEQVISPRYTAERIEGRRGERVSAEFRCKGDPARYRHTVVKVLSRERRFLYTLEWEGPVSGAAAGEKVLGELVGSWRFLIAR